MASPTRLTVLTPSRSMRRRAAWGSNRCWSTTLPPQWKQMNDASWAAPCMSGAIGKVALGSRAFACSATCSGLVAGWPAGSPPPMPEKKMSSWRHITPLGMPVVREAVCVLLELCVGQPVVVADDDLTLGDDGDDRLEDVSQVELPGCTVS